MVMIDRTFNQEERSNLTQDKRMVLVDPGGCAGPPDSAPVNRYLTRDPESGDLLITLIYCAKRQLSDSQSVLTGCSPIYES